MERNQMNPPFVRRTRGLDNPDRKIRAVLARSHSSIQIRFILTWYGRKQGNGGTQAWLLPPRNDLEPSGWELGGSIFFPPCRHQGLIVSTWSLAPGRSCTSRRACPSKSV